MGRTFRALFPFFAVLALVGGLLLSVGFVWGLAFPPTYSDPERRTIVVLLFAGAGLGFAGSLLAALATPRQDGYQKVGLFILAAAFVLALTTIYHPVSFFP